MQNGNNEMDTVQEPQGQKCLSELIDTVADGEPPSPQLMLTINRFLNNVQAKVDLTQMGIVKFHLSRIKRLSKLIEFLEDELIPPDAETSALSQEEKILLLKHFAKDIKVSVDYVTERATKPTISSPDGMKSAAGEETRVKNTMASALSPERRQRIRNLSLMLANRLQRKNSALDSN